MTETQGWIIIILFILLIVEVFWLGCCIEGDIKNAAEGLEDSIRDSIHKLSYSDLAFNVLRIKSIMESKERRKREKRKKKEVEA